MAWPIASPAQERRAIVGFLSSRSAADSADVEPAFRKGLNEAGYFENRTVQIVYRWADGTFERLPHLATELVEQHVDAIAAVGGDISVRVAMAATNSIPIIMVTGTDPAKAVLSQVSIGPEGTLRV